LCARVSLFQDDIKKLFQEFVQINPGELQKGQGSGLGLSICKSIVQLHGGGVWVESEGKGRGSTFNVALPLYRRTTSVVTDLSSPQKRLQSSHSSSFQESGKSWLSRGQIMSLPVSPRAKKVPRLESPLNSPPPSLHNSILVGMNANYSQGSLSNVNSPVKNDFDPDRVRFLVVDDSTPNRRMLGRLLEREGHTTVEADDGVTAVEAISRMMKVAKGEPIDVTTNSGALLASKTPRHQKKIVRSTLKYDGKQRIDVILMDFQMVTMNGPEAAHAIRELGFTGPIIGVTGLMDEECDVFVEMGANSVLCKPVNFPSIWKALQSINFV
jgi:CheY-like chemotaxis protein